MKNITLQLLLTLLAFFTHLAICSEAASECIEKDDEPAGYGTKAGASVDDMDILGKVFERGMSVTAINYCLGKEHGDLLSVQVVMSKKTNDNSHVNRKTLRKFGAKGGTCYRWNL